MRTLARLDRCAKVARAVIIAAAIACLSGPLAAQTAPSVPPAAKPAQPVIPFGGPVVFTVALGSVATINAEITVALANRLKKTLTTADVVPEGSWGLNEFVTQCETDPNTVGAFIVLPPAAGSQSEDYLVLIRNSITVQMNAMIAECKEKAAKIVWVSATATGQYGRSQVQFLPFAVLTSVYLAFAPQRTYQTTSTSAFPTPNPLPPGGARTSVQTQSSTVLNASGTSSLQQQVVNAVAGQSLVFGRQGNADHLTMGAADDAVGKLIEALDADCGRGHARRGHPQTSVVAQTEGRKEFCSW